MTNIFFVLLMASLVGNRYQLLNVAALLLFIPLRLASGRPAYGDERPFPRSTLRWVKAAYAFWLTSYLLTRAPLSNLFSFDFLRRDGALLFAYLPLLVVTDYGLDQALVQKLLRGYLWVMSVISVFGALLYLEALGNLSLSERFLPEDLRLVVYSPLSGFEFHGFFEAHNSTGAIYGLASCIALALLVFAPRLRIFSAPTFWFAATFLGVMLSKSRTAYVSFALTAAILLVRARNFRRVISLALFLIMPVVLFTFVQPEVSQRAEAVTSTDDPNVVERLIYFVRAKDDFLASPLVGIGFGRFNDEYLGFSGIENVAYVATDGEVVNESTHAHNSYLHFLAEGGLIGFTLMMGIWISAFRWARRMQSGFEPNSFPFAFAVGVQTCILFEFGISFTEHSMGTAITSLTVFTLFGLLRNLAAAEAGTATVPAPIPMEPRPSLA